MSRTQSSTERGQAFTLESIFASLLLLTAVLFVLQTTAVTPLSGSTSSAQMQNQQAAITEGVLGSAEERGYLKDIVLYTDDNGDSWDNNNGVTYSSPNDDGFKHPFGNQLQDTYISRGYAVNVQITYYSEDMDSKITHDLIDMGSPSPNSVTGDRTVVLYGDDQIRNADGSQSGQTLSGSGFHIDEVNTSSDLYNIATVEVEIWRI